MRDRPLVTRTLTWLLCLLWTAVSGCYVFKSPQTPMPVVRHEAPSPAPATGLMILLPGFADGPEHFDEFGLVAAARRTAPGFDIIATDAHFGYYRKLSVVDRLHEDVIGPLRDRYSQIWLVGISMGGLGAVSYAMDHPALVDGIVLLAPFMGSERIVADVEAAGGLEQWTPADLDSIDGVRERHYERIWQWYKGYTQPEVERPALYLGFGEEDSLGRANRLVANVLPPDHTKVTPGGHKWTVWTPLFESLMRTAAANEALSDVKGQPQPQASSRHVSRSR